MPTVMATCSNDSNPYLPSVAYDVFKYGDLITTSSPSGNSLFNSTGTSFLSVFAYGAMSATTTSSGNVSNEDSFALDLPDTILAGR